MRFFRLVFGVVLGVSLVVTQTGSAFADEAQLLDLVKGLQKQIEAQSQRIQQLESQGAGGGSISNVPLSQLEKDVALLKRQQEVNQEVQIKNDKDFNKKVGESLGGADKWLKDLSFYGDLRLRYEAIKFTSGARGADTNGNDPDRNRFRFRVRYGFEKKFSPEWKAGFGLAVSDSTTSSNGLQADPTSANTTFTNNFDYKNIWVDKAYAAYSPDWAKIGPISNFSITGGKTDNPFERGSKQLIWKMGNVRPEGLAETADFNLYEGDNVNLKAYGLLGQYVLQEKGAYPTFTGSSPTGSQRDAELFAYQVGINPSFSTGLSAEPIEELSTLTLYSYPGYAGNSNWKINGITGTSLAKGNPVSSDATGLDASHFNVLNTYHEFTVKAFGTPVTPFFEYAKNLSDKSTTFGIQDASNAWALGINLGKVQKKGSWEANYAYKNIGANSIVGAFADSDFGDGRGAPGNKGSVIGLGYGLTDFLKLNFAGYLTKPLDPGFKNGVSGSEIADKRVARFQTDLTWKF